MTISVQQTAGYGMFLAVALLADGREVEGWGLTEQQATYRAQSKAAQEPCVGCGAGVSAAEADVCRAARIPVLCARCREGRRPAGWYDASDPER